MDENGIPADLVIIEGHVMVDLPQMSFFSPSGDHDCAVVFSPDPLITDNERTGEIYALIDEMPVQKQQMVKKVREFFMERESGNCEGSHEI